MPKQRIYLLIMLLTILGLSLLSCSKEEKIMRNDRHWAKEYLNSIGREHYHMILCAAAESKRITRIPSDKQKTYSYAPISSSKSIETIKLLSRMGLNMDFTRKGKTPLMLAASASEYSIVHTLLQLGANPLAKDTQGKTALDYAQENPKIAQILQEALDNIQSEIYEISKPHKREIEHQNLIDDALEADSLEHADSLKIASGFRYQTKLLQKAEVSKQILIPKDASANKIMEQDPILRTAVNPIYPTFAKEKNISATVMMEVQVMPNGRVDEARVINSDDPGFDAAALRAVKASRFAPAQKGGFPVRGETIIEAIFEASPL